MLKRLKRAVLLLSLKDLNHYLEFSPVDESLWEEIIDFTRIKKEELTLKNY